jgi:hypothetical protein
MIFWLVVHPLLQCEVNFTSKQKTPLFTAFSFKAKPEERMNAVADESLQFIPFSKNYFR